MSIQVALTVPGGPGEAARIYRDEQVHRVVVGRTPDGWRALSLAGTEPAEGD